jgi:hypothetical protein
MCDPATATVFMVSSALVSAYSQYASGQYNKAVGEGQAKVERWKAKDAIKRGEVEVDNKQVERNLMLGAQRAQAAANGGLVDSGSSSWLQGDTAGMAALDINTTRSNFRREAWGHKVEATNALARAKLASAEGTFGAVSSLLSAGSAASKGLAGGGGGDDPLLTSGGRSGWHPS